MDDSYWSWESSIEIISISLAKNNDYIVATLKDFNIVVLSIVDGKIVFQVSLANIYSDKSSSPRESIIIIPKSHYKCSIPSDIAPLDMLIAVEDDDAHINVLTYNGVKIASIQIEPSDSDGTSGGLYDDESGGLYDVSSEVISPSSREFIYSEEDLHEDYNILDHTTQLSPLQRWAASVKIPRQSQLLVSTLFHVERARNAFSKSKKDFLDGIVKLKEIISDFYGIFQTIYNSYSISHRSPESRGDNPKHVSKSSIQCIIPKTEKDSKETVSGILDHLQHLETMRSQLKHSSQSCYDISDYSSQMTPSRSSYSSRSYRSSCSSCSSLPSDTASALLLQFSPTQFASSAPSFSPVIPPMSTLHSFTMSPDSLSLSLALCSGLCPTSIRVSMKRVQSEIKEECERLNRGLKQAIEKVWENVCAFIFDACSEIKLAGSLTIYDSYSISHRSPESRGDNPKHVSKSSIQCIIPKTEKDSKETVSGILDHLQHLETMRSQLKHSSQSCYDISDYSSQMTPSRSFRSSRSSCSSCSSLPSDTASALLLPLSPTQFASSAPSFSPVIPPMSTLHSFTMSPDSLSLSLALCSGVCPTSIRVSMKRVQSEIKEECERLNRGLKQAIEKVWENVCAFIFDACSEIKLAGSLVKQWEESKGENNKIIIRKKEEEEEELPSTIMLDIKNELQYISSWQKLYSTFLPCVSLSHDLFSSFDFLLRSLKRLELDTARESIYSEIEKQKQLHQTHHSVSSAQTGMIGSHQTHSQDRKSRMSSHLSSRRERLAQIAFSRRSGYNSTNTYGSDAQSSSLPLPLPRLSLLLPRLSLLLFLTNRRLLSRLVQTHFLQIMMFCTQRHAVLTDGQTLSTLSQFVVYFQCSGLKYSTMPVGLIELSRSRGKA
ncbi:hypothetical protein ADUPG1_013334 [Aduncisulcus paluster]|uniref:Uncharacterized protein n=1 Tax=Aduncisulcus paluster TaxID=2918883 RepID=A0ABQ5K2J9_9EUKA|nr:hypothetical protein ADUPG1_013334 [Aduncisulcus paluster]